MKKGKAIRRVARGWFRPSKKDLERTEKGIREQEKTRHARNKGKLQKQTERLRKALTASSTAEITKVTKEVIPEILGELAEFNDIGKKHRKKYWKHADRMATKYALDAAGIKGSKKREKIHEILNQIDTIGERQKEGLESNAKNKRMRLIREMDREIGNMKSTAVVFRRAYLQVKIKKSFERRMKPSGQKSNK